MTTQTRVVCVGDNCLDCYLPPVNRTAVGGSCANVAVALARQGVETAYFGAVGRDAAGARVMAALRRKGVDVTHVVRNDALPTAITEITLTSGGERLFREEYAINDAYSPPPDLVELAGNARHIHATRLTHHLADLQQSAAHGQATLSYDFSDHGAESRLYGLEVAFISQPTGDPSETIRTLHRDGVRCAVVLRGAAGSVASEAGEVVEMPAGVASRVVDTCGAGDAFIGSFLASRLAGRTLKECLTAGSKAGTATCAFIGAFPQ